MTSASRATRSFEDARGIMLLRARQSRNPFADTVPAEAEQILHGLDTLERDTWADAFSRPGSLHEERARQLETAGDRSGAGREYRLAYGLYRVGRYPAPNSPRKADLYRRSQEMYRRAAELLDQPFERVEMRFAGQPAEGPVAVGLLREPTSAGRAPWPVLVSWGGIDSFKEERQVDEYLDAGMASLAIDMPGVADAPLAGSETGERLWDAVLDWIETRPELDAGRVGVLGGSTGGYWATKVAHTHRGRLRCAVNQGGPAHYAFTPEWIERAQTGEYPFELAETLACAFGRATYADWLSYSPRLSLLEQGILDRPCAPLLCVNGVDDSVFPIRDMHLLLEHGSPKAARLFLGSGHMGHPGALPTILAWLRDNLL